MDKTGYNKQAKYPWYKGLKRFLGYISSTFIIFYSGAWCFWLEFNFNNPFIKLSWIPLFCIGILLNMYFIKSKIIKIIPKTK